MHFMFHRNNSSSYIVVITTVIIIVIRVLYRIFLPGGEIGLGETAQSLALYSYI